MVMTKEVSGSVVTNTKKLTKGRQKIEMKKIQETSNLQVAFSKRRNGLFKKATEICVLIGAQADVLVTSPGGRFFALGHPNPDLMFNQYPNNNNNKDYATSSATLDESHQHYLEVERELETEKKRAETIPVSSGGSGSPWYEEAVDHDGLELEGYISQLEELQKKILRSASSGFN